MREVPDFKIGLAERYLDGLLGWSVFAVCVALWGFGVFAIGAIVLNVIGHG